MIEENEHVPKLQQFGVSLAASLCFDTIHVSFEWSDDRNY